MRISAPARLGFTLAIVALAVVVALRVFSDGREPVAILFVGNSYTTANDLAGTLAGIASAGGHPIRTDVVAWGGAWLRDHVDQGTAGDAVVNGDWDFVVLQEQSVVPSSPTHRLEAMFPAVRQLATTAQRQGAEPVLFMTWGRRDGFPETGHASFVSMQAAITAAYTEIADELGARVAPVGETWASIMDRVDLFARDGSHPSPAGTYLAAAVLYAAIFGEDPVEADYAGGLDADAALLLRSAAAVRVLGHLERWNIPEPAQSSSG